MRSEGYILRFRPLLRRRVRSKGSPKSECSPTNGSDEFSAPNQTYSEQPPLNMNDASGSSNSFSLQERKNSFENSSHSIFKKPNSDNPCFSLRQQPRKISFATSDSDESGESSEEESDDEIKNLDRLSMRIDGFECYVLVGLWVSTSCFGDLLVGDFRNRHGALPDSLRNAAVVIGLFVCLSGLYSTVVFATTILYGKTAVGLNRDVAFFSFMQNTAPQRGRAFQCLQYSTMAYTVLVCLVASNELPNIWYVLPAMAILGYVLYRGAADIMSILASASPIYSDDWDEEDESVIEQASSRMLMGTKGSVAGRRTSGVSMRESLMTQHKTLDSVHFLKNVKHCSKHRVHHSGTSLDLTHKSNRKSSKRN